VRSQHRVVISALLGLRIGMDQRRGQARQRVQQVVFGGDRDLMGLYRVAWGYWGVWGA
jgi:hypothetical protein